jgi:hypothetical protein
MCRSGLAANWAFRRTARSISRGGTILSLVGTYFPYLNTPFAYLRTLVNGYEFDAAGAKFRNPLMSEIESLLFAAQDLELRCADPSGAFASSKEDRRCGQYLLDHRQSRPRKPFARWHAGFRQGEPRRETFPGHAANWRPASERSH